MGQNDKKKQAKARRDAIAEKLKKISTSPVVLASENDSDSQKQQQAEEPKFAPIDPNDVVSKRIEEKFAAQQQKTSSSNNQDDANASNQQQEEGDSSSNKKNSNIKNAIVLSNRQRKKASRPDIATLKAMAKRRPDLVELHDTNAADPKFLIQIKEMRNTIPVPNHWAQKSAFMSHTVDRDSNTNYEQTIMPGWILNMKISDAWKHARYDPMQLMIPFIVGHAAPATTPYGDLFFEGKDMRGRYHGYRPGVLSQRLRQALDMGTSPTVPPPWLTGIQRVAKLPPSYPNIKIPGVNAPIPSGARYGRGRNEWGEPPRDPKNNNRFLFEGVDRSLASIQEQEAAKFLSASRWGTNTASLSVSNSNNNNNSSVLAPLPSIFTASKEEIDAVKRRKQEQEEAQLRELQQQQEMIALQQQQQQMMLAQQQQQNQYRQPSNVQIPQHMLAAAGIYNNNQQQPNYHNQNSSGQFGMDVNTQRNQPGMHLLNSTGVYR